MNNEETKTIDSDIKRIAEETALALTECFQLMSDSLEENKDFCERMKMAYMLGAIKEIVRRITRYLDKTQKASFLTRWYWKRKAEKSFETLNDVVKFFSTTN